MEFKKMDVFKKNSDNVQQLLKSMCILRDCNSYHDLCKYGNTDRKREAGELQDAHLNQFSATKDRSTSKSTAWERMLNVK